MTVTQTLAYQLVPQEISCKEASKGRLERHYSDSDLDKINKLSRVLASSPTKRPRRILNEHQNAFPSKVQVYTKESKESKVSQSREKEVSCCGKIWDMVCSNLIPEARYGVSYPPGLYVSMQASGYPI